MLTGFAFGMLILNTPAAIVSFFAYSFLLPTVFLAGASLWGWAESIRPWIDFNYVQEPLMDGLLSDVNWGQFALTVDDLVRRPGRLRCPAPPASRDQVAGRA